MLIVGAVPKGEENQSQLLLIERNHTQYQLVLDLMALGHKKMHLEQNLQEKQEKRSVTWSEHIHGTEAIQRVFTHIVVVIASVF